MYVTAFSRQENEKISLNWGKNVSLLFTINSARVKPDNISNNSVKYGSNLIEALLDITDGFPSSSLTVIYDPYVGTYMNIVV